MTKQEMDVISLEIFEQVEYFLKACPNASEKTVVDSILGYRDAENKSTDDKKLYRQLAHEAFRKYSR